MRGIRGISGRRAVIAAVGVLFVLALAAVHPAAAKVGPGDATFPWVTPVFGMATAPDGSLLVADYGQGIVQLKKGTGKLVAGLPMVNDIAPIGSGNMFAITGGGGAEMGYSLYRVSRGGIQQIADLFRIQVPDRQQVTVPWHRGDHVSITGCRDGLPNVVRRADSRS